MTSLRESKNAQQSLAALIATANLKEEISLE